MLSVLLPGIFLGLVLQRAQGLDQAAARAVRHDDVVDVAQARRDEGVGEAFLVFGLARGQGLGVAGLLAEDDLDRALGAHDRDLGGGPGVVDVAAQVLGAHDVIGAAIGLAGDDGQLGHRGLGIGEQQLGAVLDQGAVLPCLVPGMKPGTSTSVTNGMWKASQKRTKRAALRLESMSSTPART